MKCENCVDEHILKEVRMYKRSLLASLKFKVVVIVTETVGVWLGGEFIVIRK